MHSIRDITASVLDHRGEYLDLRGRKWWEAGEDCIMRSFIICVPHQILLKVKIKMSLCFSLIERHAMKAYWGSGGIAPRII
jgi:hypothetical protein